MRAALLGTEDLANDLCAERTPQALELAAAWTRVLSCAEIAAELRRGAELLHDGLKVEHLLYVAGDELADLVDDEHGNEEPLARHNGLAEAVLNFDVQARRIEHAVN